MTEFKVGDRVQIVDNLGSFESYTGEQGAISYVATFPDDFYGQEYVLTLDATDEYGQFYRVSLDDPDVAFGTNIYFFESELEKLED